MGVTLTPPLLVPKTVHLMITNACNLRCKHCFASSTNASDDELTIREWITILYQFVDARVLSLIVSGGEIFVKDGILDFFAELDQLPLHYSVNTNATLVTPEIASFFAKLDRPPRFSISIDGSCLEIHDELRGRGAFDRAIQGVQCLLDAHIRLSFFTVVNRFNKDDIENILDLAKSLNVSGVKFNGYVPVGRGCTFDDVLYLSAAERCAIAKRIYELHREHGNFVGGTFVGTAKKVEEILTQKEKLGGTPRSLGMCGAANMKCAVRSDGKVLPCELATDLVAGDLRKNDIITIWRNSQILHKIRQMKDILLSELPGCRACICNSVCNTGCPAAALAIHGVWGGRDNMCWIEEELGDTIRPEYKGVDHYSLPYGEEVLLTSPAFSIAE